MTLLKGSTTFLGSPARVVIAVGLVILVSELLIMLLIASFVIPNQSRSYPGIWDFIDPLMLTALVLPALYLLIFRPMRNQQELFRMLTETIASGVMLHRGGKMLYVNPAFERLTGFTREELLDMEYWESGLPDTREVLLDRVAARLRGEALSGRAQSHINTKSGVDTWAEVSAATTAYRGGTAVLATYIDITERKRAEEARAQAQQKLAQIVLGNPVPMFVIDDHHVVTHWNQACEAITGIRVADMVGTKNHWRPFSQQQRPLLPDLVMDGASEAEFIKIFDKDFHRSELIEGAYDSEKFYPSLGEHGLWLYCTAAPLKDEQMHLVGSIATLQDITERKLAEEALRHVHSDLERLVQSRTAELEQANLRLAEDVNKREQAEVELRRRNAELLGLNTRLGEAQEQLLQSEKMASIGQLAAGVAHEINNPIGYVHSNIGSLEGYLGDLFRILDAYAGAEEGLPADLPMRAELLRVKTELDLAFLRRDIPALMAESKEGITRVRKIVQDLKDFSHVDSSQEWKWADLHKGLDSTLNVVSNEIKYKADVIKEYGVLPEIECLPSELNQVFLNLLVNAAHAIGEGARGSITLRTGMDAEQVWVEVSDTGQGIAPDNLKRIFDPFFTTKPVGKGTGLGLALSYGIVQKHGGRIEVNSEPGKGTRFRVILPVAQVHEEAVP